MVGTLEAILPIENALSIRFSYWSSTLRFDPD